MTIAQVYDLKRQAYRQHSARWDRIRKSAYPETGGVSLYIHNWIACSDRPDADLAGIIADSGEWASWHRIEDRLTRWYNQAEHRSHAGKFSPLWCAFCQNAD